MPSEQLNRGDEYDSNIDHLLSVEELYQSQPSSILFHLVNMISNTQTRNEIFTQYSLREHQRQQQRRLRRAPRRRKYRHRQRRHLPDQFSPIYNYGTRQE